MLRLLSYEWLIDKRLYYEQNTERYRYWLTKKIRVYFLLTTNNESAWRYSFRSISSFSNLVLSIFRRPSTSKIALVFFFSSPLLDFNIDCRETTSSFLRVSIKVRTFGWDLKILLLNLLFRNRNDVVS